MDVKVSRPVAAKQRIEQILGVAYRREQWNAEFNITPVQARLMLETVRLQRPVRPAKVAFWTDLIKRGKALATPQGIMVDTKGELMDGQHRLLGCIEAGRPLKAMVFFNRPDDEFKAYDRGAVRTLGDDLTMLGVAGGAESNVIQAAARLVWNFDHGRMPWISWAVPTADEIIVLLDKHPKLQPTAVSIYRNRGGGARPLPPAPTGAMFTLFREAHEDQALEFLEQLRTGAYIGTNSPAMIMRNSIDRDRSRRFNDARSAFIIRLVHAWNAHIQHRKVATLVSVPIDNKFPKIKGYPFYDED